MIYFLFFFSVFIFYFEEEVRKYTLYFVDFIEFIHYNNPLLLQYYENEYLELYEIKEEVKEVKEVKELESEKQEQVELYENKYLVRFKNFTNEYSFNELDLKYENNKFNKLINDYNYLIKSLEVNILNNTTKMTSLLSFEEELKDELLIKYPNGEIEKISDETDETEFDVKVWDDYDKLCDLREIITNERNKLEKDSNKLINLKEKTEEILNVELKEESHSNMIDNKLNGFINNYIIENTPVGNVIMRFNNNKKSFEYYSNHSVPYRYLEPIGRKYVLTYRCKDIFVNMDEEIEKANKLNEIKKNEKKNENKIFKLLDKSLIQNNKVEMSQNRNSQTIINPINNIDMIIKNANRYTWEGTLCDFKIIKTEKKSNANKISFKEFKTICILDSNFIHHKTTQI